VTLNLRDAMRPWQGYPRTGAEEPFPALLTGILDVSSRGMKILVIPARDSGWPEEHPGEKQAISIIR